MRKAGIFWPFFMLFGMMQMRVVDGEGGTEPDGGDPGDDIGDVTVEIEQETTGGDGGGDTVSREEFDAVRNIASELAREREYFRVINDFKEKYPDFDEQKVVGKLKEIAKDDPQLSKQMNNQMGLENIYLKYFHAKPVTNDPTNGGGKGGSEPVDIKALKERAVKGDHKAFDQLIDEAK